MKIDTTFLRSRVARRIFALFVLSALLPVGLLALLSFSQVTEQLIEHGYDQLHRDSKAVAMTLFERLSTTESELEFLGRQQDARGGSNVSLPEQAARRLRDRFLALRIESPGGTHRMLIGEMDSMPALTESEERHLHKGKAVVRSRIDEDGRSRVFMTVALEKGALTGEVSPDFLWSLPLDATSVLCVLAEVSTEHGLALAES